MTFREIQAVDGNDFSAIVLYHRGGQPFPGIGTAVRFSHLSRLLVRRGFGNEITAGAELTQPGDPGPIADFVLGRFEGAGGNFHGIQDFYQAAGFNAAQHLAGIRLIQYSRGWVPTFI